MVVARMCGGGVGKVAWSGKAPVVARGAGEMVADGNARRGGVGGVRGQKERG